jgi:putative ABC transport system permease protein
MKYFPLVWAGLWRKRARTVLTLLSVAVAFLLFGVLHGVTATIDDALELLADTRLRTANRVNMIEAMPLAYRAQIESVPGVQAVAYYSIFFGYYQERSNGVGAGAINVEAFLEAFQEVSLPPEQRDAMLRTRTGAIAGRDLAERFGWQVGDRIPLRSSRWRRLDGGEDWTLDLVGIYDFGEGEFPANELWFHYDLLDEARSEGRGTVHFYFTTIEDGDQAAATSEQIDALFLNSPMPTQTASEKEWQRAQINQIGNIDYFINAIIGAVMFTLLFLTGNTMMQSVRERIPELAVLKTYGFRDGAVVMLVCVEAMILCGAAALGGLVLARIVFPSVFSSLGAPAFPLPLAVFGTGAVIALALALISAAPPAWRVHRLSIVDALAGR